MIFKNFSLNKVCIILATTILLFISGHVFGSIYPDQRNENSVASERADLQELISDISHQVKTPIANLKMINATLLEQSATG